MIMRTPQSIMFHFPECMYVYTYACMYVCVYTYLYWNFHKHAHTCTCLHVYTHTCTYTCKTNKAGCCQDSGRCQTWVCMHTCMYVCIYIHSSLKKYVSIGICASHLWQWAKVRAPFGRLIQSLTYQPHSKAWYAILHRWYIVIDRSKIGVLMHQGHVDQERWRHSEQDVVLRDVPPRFDASHKCAARLRWTSPSTCRRRLLWHWE
jgi:hypothetical protein